MEIDQSCMNNDPGLDYAFLKYIGVSVDGEEKLHSFYLPFLADRARVLDLGCGMGGFVKLLRTQGIDGYGVDSDPQCIAEARAHHLPVVEADVIDYLRTLEPASLDAIFSAHMVEHMPYAVVLETIQLAHRALRPGGRLVLVTPNPRALVTHLEMYHLHFGHIAMYHPKLLAFFMHYAGFAKTEMGENPHTMAAQISADTPLRTLPNFSFTEQRDGGTLLRSEAILPKPRHPLRKALWYVKMGLVHWVVQPYFDAAAQRLHQVQAQLAQTEQALQGTLQALDRPFECYVIGDKA
jgi:SAM-dependent methyltransferase